MPTSIKELNDTIQSLQKLVAADSDATTFIPTLELLFEEVVATHIELTTLRDELEKNNHTLAEKLKEETHRKGDIERLITFNSAVIQLFPKKFEALFHKELSAETPNKDLLKELIPFVSHDCTFSDADSDDETTEQLNTLAEVISSQQTIKKFNLTLWENHPEATLESLILALQQCSSLGELFITLPRDDSDNTFLMDKIHTISSLKVLKLTFNEDPRSDLRKILNKSFVPPPNLEEFHLCELFIPTDTLYKFIDHIKTLKSFKLMKITNCRLFERDHSDKFIEWKPVLIDILKKAHTSKKEFQIILSPPGDVLTHQGIAATKATKEDASFVSTSQVLGHRDSSASPQVSAASDLATNTVVADGQKNGGKKRLRDGDSSSHSLISASFRPFYATLPTVDSPTLAAIRQLIEQHSKDIPALKDVTLRISQNGENELVLPETSSTLVTNFLKEQGYEIGEPIPASADSSGVTKLAFVINKPAPKLSPSVR